MPTSSQILLCGACIATGVAAYVIIQHYRKSKASRVATILKEVGESCSAPLERLKDVAEAMYVEMYAGLKAPSGSKLKMLPSYVVNLPTGQEAGVFYALDLGGTNFRILRVKLGGFDGRIVNNTFKEVSIPPPLMTGTTEELFGFIASAVADFVAEEDKADKPLAGKPRELGFTFSFPCEQTALNRGKLIRWTKGFKVEGTEGRDVVENLEVELQKRNVNMEVTVLVNDTVGTLAGARYEDTRAAIGLILGTGTNACYVERVDAIPKLQGAGFPPSATMVINMEWGNFWSEHLPTTFADNELDTESLNPGEQRFEKMISGMYLGEIVRKFLLKLAAEAELFGPKIPERLCRSGSLPTPKVSKIDDDSSPNLAVVGEILTSSLELKNTSLSVRKTVKIVCRMVAQRGARLIAAAVYGVLKKLGRDGSLPLKPGQEPMVVAVDGGLYEHYRLFRDDIHAALNELLGESAGSVVMSITRDGSGIGAALLVASNSSYTGASRGH